MAKINNMDSIKKKVEEHLRSKVRAVLTPEEFKHVTFTKDGDILKWAASTKEIRDKIEAGLRK